MSDPSKIHLDALKKWFGHSGFRPKQWEIIRAVVEEKRDVCTVMATGYGKSLCYQFPPVFCNALGIVVSPLISLMQDQVLALKVCNIPACFFGTAQRQRENTRIGLLSGEYRLVYVTPEWCSTDFGESILSDLKKLNISITLVAIDEAHCISQWGFDFRSSYRHLGKLRQMLPNVPFMALTATATPQVRGDICCSLKLRNPLVVCTSFDRPNLYLAASTKSQNILEDLEKVIFRTNQSNAEIGSTIIYCPTKKISDSVADELKRKGRLKCELYHADLSLKVREEVHEAFVKDKINVIVATIAFGMGIDKPDVRTVIHYGAPKDLESYYQEIGRAGRDGLPSHCHILYSSADFVRNEFFFQSLSGKFLDHKRNLAKAMERYLQTSECRRKLLMSHFDNTFQIGNNPNCCDNCLSGLKKKPIIEITKDSLLMLRAVEALGGHYGLQMSVYLLRGSEAKRFPKKYTKHELFGIGKSQSEGWWKCLGNLLIRESLLQRTTVPQGSGRGWNVNNFPVSTVSLTEKGSQFLATNGSEKVAVLEPTSEMMSLRKIQLERDEFSKQWLEFTSGSEKTSLDDSQLNSCREEKAKQDDLLDELTLLRSKLAETFNCMPYMVASLMTLQLLALKQPKSLEDLAEVEGFTESKIKNFGTYFINCIRKMDSDYSTEFEVTDCSSHISQEESGLGSIKKDVHTDDWLSTSSSISQNISSCSNMKEVDMGTKMSGTPDNSSPECFDTDLDPFKGDCDTGNYFSGAVEMVAKKENKNLPVFVKLGVDEALRASTAKYEHKERSSDDSTMIITDKLISQETNEFINKPLEKPDTKRITEKGEHSEPPSDVYGKLEMDKSSEDCIDGKREIKKRTSDDSSLNWTDEPVSQKNAPVGNLEEISELKRTLNKIVHSENLKQTVKKKKIKL